MHQFEIKRFIELDLFGIDASFTNAALYMVVAITLISFLTILGMRGRALVPTRMQSIAEISYEFIANMVRDNVGPDGQKYFPFVFTLFMFVLFCNMLGMTPYSFTVTSHIIVTFALAATVFTWLYSAPPVRTKARGIWANVTIAIPRGVLLKVAGWSCVKSVLAVEPWYIGLIFGLFLLGASSTKDFADMEGDRAGGCRTLPIIYGVRTAAWMISPFFVIPFLLMPLGSAAGILTGNPVALTLLGFGLSVWGVYVVVSILRDPEALAETENHPSWTHMYLMMLTAQIGFALAYLV